MPRVTPAAWLVDEPLVERIELGQGAWIDVVRGLVPAAETVHDQLLATVPWTQGRVFRYERWMEEPRLAGWQAGPSRHQALLETETWLRQRYRVSFDGVALARYRDGRDSVGWHRDRELRWLEETVIGVLSLGQQRPFLLKPLGTGSRARAGRSDVIDLRPAGGDLLVMGGRCQAAWLHSVPKLAVGCRSRISAQWRWTSRRGRPDTAPSYYAPRHFGR